MPSSRPLDIGIDASRATPDRPTGTENYAHHVIRAILDLDRPHEYTIYHRQLAGVLQFGLRPAVHHKLVRPRRAWTHAGLSYQMLRQPPDVLFVPAHVLPIARPSRTVVTVHDLGYLRYPKTHRWTSRWYLHLSGLFHARVATRLIADSNSTKRDMVDRYGADPVKIAVVHLGVGAEFQPASPNEASKVREDYAGGQEYLLFVGTVQPRKNVSGLLQAYRLLRDELPRAPLLVIAGKRGWLSDPIYAQATSLGLADAVRWVDYVPQAELPALFSGACAFVFPSLHEGFGLPVLEAMACGTPVIAANAASLPELGGDAAILVDPHDHAALARAMAAVISDERLRAELREKGLARAAQFTWARCAEETLNVLEDAAAS